MAHATSGSPGLLFYRVTLPSLGPVHGDLGAWGSESDRTRFESQRKVELGRVAVCEDAVSCPGGLQAMGRCPCPH